MRNTITAEAADRIRTLHAQGRGIKDLATEHGVSTTTISRTLRMQLHVPPGVRVVPVVLSRRVHALAALRAADANETVETLLAEVIERTLEGGKRTT